MEVEVEVEVEVGPNLRRRISLCAILIMLLPTKLNTPTFFVWFDGYGIFSSTHTNHTSIFIEFVPMDHALPAHVSCPLPLILRLMGLVGFDTQRWYYDLFGLLVVWEAKHGQPLRFLYVSSPCSRACVRVLIFLNLMFVIMCL